MPDNSSTQSQQTPGALGTPRGKFMLYLKGVAMGLGDSVPGISGGTIAVITKIYDQLVFSIRAVDLTACRLFFGGQFKALWQYINGTFLLILAVGILSGLLISASTVLYLLENYYAPLMAFFIGMVLTSSWLLKNEFSTDRLLTHPVLAAAHSSPAELCLHHRHAAGIGFCVVALAAGRRLSHAPASSADTCTRRRGCCITAVDVCRKC